jgi:hypothetical protein
MIAQILPQATITGVSAGEVVETNESQLNDYSTVVATAFRLPAEIKSWLQLVSDRCSSKWRGSRSSFAVGRRAKKTPIKAVVTGRYI